MKKHACRLNLPGKPCTLHLSLAANAESETTKEKEVMIQLQSLCSDYVTPAFTAITTKSVLAPLRCVNVNPQEYSHLQNIKLTEKYPQEGQIIIDLILEVNMALSLLNTNVAKGEFHGPKASFTRLGAILWGEYEESDPIHTKIAIAASVTKQDGEWELWKRFFSVEDLGIKAEHETIYSYEEEKALKFMEENTSYNETEKRFTVNLPFKSQPQKCLDSHYPVAFRLAQASHKKAVRSEVIEQVDAAVDKMLKAGACRIVPESESKPPQCHFLPTHAIWQPRSNTMAVRMVQDASSKCKQTGMSINQTLYQGPVSKWMPDVLKLILRIRCYPHIILGDVSMMFWMIKVAQKDRRWQRFMYQGENDKLPRIYEMLAVVMGMICSPFIALFIVRKLCTMNENSFKDAVAAVRDSQYVDDLCAVADSEEEAIKIAIQMVGLFAKASMKVHKIMASTTAIMDKAGIEIESRSQQDVHRILGVQWRPKTDTIEFSFADAMDDNKVETRRTILSQLSRIWDPSGQISPVILVGKMILAKTWSDDLNLSWDTPLPEELAKEWRKFKEGVKALDHVSLPRLILRIEERSTAFLACLTDASQEAIGVAIYIVGERSQLLISKTRVAPKNSSKTKSERLSIVRLELLALLCGTRLISYVKETFPPHFFSGEKYFTDSLVNLKRVRHENPQKFRVWVANRLAEIKHRAHSSQFFFVPGKVNSADFCSRGLEAKEIAGSKLWNEGPQFLTQPQETWPIERALTKEEAEELESINKAEWKSTDKTEISASVRPKVGKCSSLLGLQDRVSKFGKMSRITCYVFRFLLKKFPALTRKTKLFSNAVLGEKGDLRCGELRIASAFWIRCAQREGFEKEITLEGDKIIAKQGGKLDMMGLFEDEAGLLRVVTRLDLSEKIPKCTARPILLPRDNEIVTKIVLHFHHLYCHVPLSTMRYFLQRNFHLQGGRKYLGKILSTCRGRNCKKLIKLSAVQPPLPLSRVDPEPLDMWAHIGVDMMGPIYFKNDGDCPECSDKVMKGYGAIYVDFFTRAIYLDLVRSLGTEDFLFSFAKMCARRGTPKSVYCDQAKTFKCGDKELRRIYRSIDWDKVKREGVSKQVEFLYSTAYASWGNGVTERMVGFVKKALRSTLADTKKMKYAHLEGILANCELLTNSRPLLATTEDVDDESTITPGKLLLGRDLLPLPYDQSPVSDEMPFSRMWFHRKRLVNQYFRTWRKDYLVGQCGLQYCQKSGDPPLKIGQIVFINDHKDLKPTFKMAKVEQLLRGKDNVIRRVKLKVSSGAVVDRHLKHVSITEQDAQDILAERARNRQK